MCLREGLVLCLDIQALAVEVELDCRPCRDLLLQLPRVKVSHCFREANFLIAWDCIVIGSVLMFVKLFLFDL